MYCTNLHFNRTCSTKWWWCCWFTFTSKSSCMEKCFFNCLIHATSKLRIFAAQQIRFQLRLLLYYDTIISGDDLFHFNKGLKSLCWQTLICCKLFSQWPENKKTYVNNIKWFALQNLEWNSFALFEHIIVLKRLPDQKA